MVIYLFIILLALIVIKRFREEYHGIPHLPFVFLGIHVRLKARVYTEKIHVTSKIFHAIAR